MSNLLGQRIGHFRVVDLLGKGGMGEVYVGYDETLERKVALKTIKAERRLDETAKARFLREARVLSQLHHPNICQIFDYIAGDGADILVLELVKGRTLSKVAKDLSFRQKLDVALQITNVLIAAHEKGIVHRDLKPDNVMIDDAGVVKVLDFGLSRSKIDEDTLQLVSPTAETLPRGLESAAENGGVSSSSGKLTTDGMVMGTLGYMSPEQARGEVASPASDVYSLGLLLQELFTGSPPYETSGSPHDLLHRASEGKTVPIIGLESDLTGLLNRMKSASAGLRPSAIDVSERIQTLIAKPARRAKQLLQATAVAVLLVVSVCMTVLMIRARQAEDVAQRAVKTAEKEAAAAKQVTEFLVEVFRNVDPYPTPESRGQVTAKELLDRSVLRIGAKFEHQPEVRASLLNALGKIYWDLGEMEKAEQLLVEGLALRESISPADSIEVGDCLYSLGLFYSGVGRPKEATELLERSLAIGRAKLGPDHQTTQTTRWFLVGLYQQQGRDRDIEALLAEDLRTGERLADPSDTRVADTMNELALHYQEQGRWDDASELLERSLRIEESALGPSDPAVAHVLALQGNLYLKQGRLDEADAKFTRNLQICESRTDLPPTKLVVALIRLADVKEKRGQLEEAEALHLRSFQLAERVASAEDSLPANFGLLPLGEFYLRHGRYEEADTYLVRALAIREKLFFAPFPAIARAAYVLGSLRAKQGRTVEAVGLLEKAVAASGNNASIPASLREDYAALAGDPRFEKLAAKAQRLRAAN